MKKPAVLKRLGDELAAAPEERRFGSGWIAGTLALVSGATALLMMIAMRYPAIFTTPELAVIRDSAGFRPFLYFVLIAGFALSALSLVLRRTKTLGTTAMVLTLAASLIGSLPSPSIDVELDGVFFGLDFFVLNVLFTGFLFIPLERIFPHREGQQILRTEWREDLFYYLVSSMMVQVLAFLTFAPSRALLSTGGFDAVRGFISGLPWLVQLIAVMFLTDFVQYWVHRAFHRVPALWRFHAVHHSAQSMDWIAGARMHFLEIIVLRAASATPMLVLGFDQSVMQTYILVVYVYSALIHANVEFHSRLRFLERILVSPRFHHWHHGIEREAIDVNFAIHFPLLDKLFGTYHMPGDRWPSGYGIAGHPVPRGYWRQFLYPFRREKEGS